MNLDPSSFLAKIARRYRSRFRSDGRYARRNAQKLF
jgi:hypothetical protein